MSDKKTIQQGTTPVSGDIRIEIDPHGPYIVYGKPPIYQLMIVPNQEGHSWSYAKGDSYQSHKVAALCRCGDSCHKPFCDGSHMDCEQSLDITAPAEPLLDDAELFIGKSLTVSDNPIYCAFARFCDAKGSIWNLIENDSSDDNRELIIREANMCPSGRLSAWDNETQHPFEPELEASIALLQDLKLDVSGPIWVRGGIPISVKNGDSYEIRNRVTLCRCGNSSNKPFCDGSHAKINFKDGLNMEIKDNKNT